LDASEAQQGNGCVTKGSAQKVLDFFANPSTHIDSAIPEVEKLHRLLFVDRTYRMSAANQSIFYDIGSGFGKICWHAAFQYQVRSIGSDIHPGRVECARKTAKQYISKKLPLFPVDAVFQRLEFTFEDVVAAQEQVKQPFTDPSNPSMHCTHIYSFNKVFGKPQLYLIAKRLNLTQFKVLSWTIDPKNTHHYGVRGVIYLGNTTLKMIGGSGESFS
jgi:hypothetical protein